jgi:type I restriction enzyme S subunit
MNQDLILGEVCQHISYGVTTSAVDRKQGPRLLRITDITDDGVDWDKVPGCIISEKEKTKSKLLDGDIVVARTGGTVGKSFLIRKPPSAVCASYLLRLRPNQSLILPDYLNLFLGSDVYWSQLYEAAQGAAQPNVNATTLSKLILPVPGIIEQCRIAARLKAQLAEVEKTRKAAEVRLIETTKLADSIVLDSINRNKTEKHRLGDVLEEVKMGIGKNWADYPVLGATRQGLAPAKEPPGKNPERYKPVFPGTVFYNPMRILIGSIALVDDDDALGITSPDYVALKGKKKTVDSRWFYYWLRSRLGEQCINSLARGAVRERMLFNRLAEGNIELPDYDIQQTASNALAVLKPMRRAIEQELNDISLLPTKLLSKAFEIN